MLSRACPLLVPLIEEGFADKKITELVIREYLDEIDREGYADVIMGCTHYPLIKNQIARIYPHFKLIDSAVETASFLKQRMQELGLFRESDDVSGQISLYASDITESLKELEILFFGHAVQSLEKVSFDWW